MSSPAHPIRRTNFRHYAYCQITAHAEFWTLFDPYRKLVRGHLSASIYCSGSHPMARVTSASVANVCLVVNRPAPNGGNSTVFMCSLWKFDASPWLFPPRHWCFAYNVKSRGKLMKRINLKSEVECNFRNLYGNFRKLYFVHPPPSRSWVFVPRARSQEYDVQKSHIQKQWRFLSRSEWAGGLAGAMLIWMQFWW